MFILKLLKKITGGEKKLSQKGIQRKILELSSVLGNKKKSKFIQFYE